ncbi:hypothetical protein P9281_01765 [Caballeronia sp. LP003]|uniref:hypothetical protein n=1 Tax=Caballeronia sp. LP003 TaxID=3038551 RepID=UPI002862DE3C|nr:hypothetical protein [Caballeronia sp. LP003]MDR5785285.1 hypothetical protein [Caballeronia sp. LP003]
MYPASRESAAFDVKAMMGYARPVPNKWRGLEGRFFDPGLQHKLTLLVADHMKKGPDVAGFIETVRRMEQVHIVTFEENYAAHRAKGCYDTAGIELLDWLDLPENVRRTLYRRKPHGAVSNAKQFAV